MVRKCVLQVKLILKNDIRSKLTSLSAPRTKSQSNQLHETHGNTSQATTMLANPPYTCTRRRSSGTDTSSLSERRSAATACEFLGFIAMWLSGNGDLVIGKSRARNVEPAR